MTKVCEVYFENMSKHLFKRKKTKPMVSACSTLYGHLCDNIFRFKSISETTVNHKQNNKNILRTL